MSKSSSDPITRRASSSCPSDGSSSARSRGLDDAGSCPRIGKISTAEASHSYVSRRSGSCCESYAIQHDLSGQTLRLYADGGYQGPLFRRAMAKIMAQVNVEIVKRSDHAKGFIVLPKRWVVERTFAWLGRCRRLAKDWENLNRRGLAFLRLASIRLMLRKLC